MDSKDNFIKSFRQMIESIDEDYLIGISNKGLYNRAVKDMGDGTGISVNIEEGQVKVNLPDGSFCELTADIKKYKCTCPSRSICKHVLIGILFIRQNSGTFFGEGPAEEVEKQAAADFSSVLAVTPKELKKLAGEKAYGDILFRMRFGVKAEIEEGSLLNVRFPDENIWVRFPPHNPLRDSVCSCKASDFCRHRAEAVIHYKLSKGLFSEGDSCKAEKADIPEDTIKEVSKFLSEILTLGLSRLPETSAENMEQMAVICHSAGLPTLEKLFRRLKFEAELYFKKDAAFSRDSMQNTIVLIYGICQGLLNNSDNTDLMQELTGEHKSSYHDIPPIELHGLGAEAWVSKSGYEGITFYFFAERLKTILTYSNSRPTYYDDYNLKLSRMYKSSPPWGIAGSCEEFSKSRIRLAGGKLNEDGRLSSSEQTSGSILGRTAVMDIDLKHYIMDDWMHVLEKLDRELSDRIFDMDENYNLMILNINHWGKSRYDNVKQLFTIPLYDREEKILDILLQYSNENRHLIERLENIERMGTFPQMLLCKSYVRDSALAVFPITAFYNDGRIVNLTLE